MHHPDHVRGETFLVTFSYVTTPYNKKFTPGPFKKRYLTFGLFVTRFLIKRPHSIEKFCASQKSSCRRLTYYLCTPYNRKFMALGLLLFHFLFLIKLPHIIEKNFCSVSKL